MALVGTQVITGIIAKVPVVGQCISPEGKRDQQDSVHQEALQGARKEAREDEERPNDQA